MTFRIVGDRFSYPNRKTIPYQIIQKGFFLIFSQNLQSATEMWSNLLVNQSILLENPLSKVTVLFRISLHLYLRYLLIVFALLNLQFQGKVESEQFHYRLGQILYKREHLKGELFFLNNLWHWLNLNSSLSVYLLHCHTIYYL